MADVGRLPERREEIAKALLVHLVEGEGHAEVGDAILLGHGGGGGVEVRAEPAEVRDHALGGQGLEAAHRLGGVGLVVQEGELDRHLLPGDHDAARRVQVLDGDLVARPHLRPARAIAARERNDGAHLDGLGPRGKRPQSDACQDEKDKQPHRSPPVALDVIPTGGRASGR